MADPTHIVALDVRDGQLLGEILRNGALAAACWASDDPHVAVVVVGCESAIDLLDRAGGCIVHW